MMVLPNSSQGLDGQDREWLLKLTRRLLAEAQAISSRTAAVNEIATAINQSLELDAILGIIGKQAKWLLDFEHCSVCLLDSGQCTTLFGSPWVDSVDTLTEYPLIQRALKSRYPQISRKTAEEETTASSDPFPSQVVLPLETDGRMLGVLTFATSKVNAYNQEDLRIGHLLALQLAAAIRNAQQFQEIRRLNTQLALEQERSDRLLWNILPNHIAAELKHHGKVEPVAHPSVSVLFTDFCGFTKVAEQLTAKALVMELDECFSSFDRVMERYGLEKLKTSGDSYMAVAGLMTSTENHACTTVAAAIELQAFVQQRRQQRQAEGLPCWNIRLGIHSGPIVAGVIGRNRFAYDIWGDTVNIAARMENQAPEGSINISRATYEQVKAHFTCRYRGKILAKNKGYLDMYIVVPEPLGWGDSGEG